MSRPGRLMVLVEMVLIVFDTMYLSLHFAPGLERGFDTW